MLERSYSSVVPHNAAYWENEDADTLRAENYQDLVNALLILIGEHAEDGVVRLYGEHANKTAMAGDACVEVQQETPVGAYLLDYITYSGKEESGYYELTVHFRYRRTAEDYAAVVNATSTEALPDLMRAAIEDGRGALAVRFGYFGTDRSGLMAMVSAVHDEVYPPEPPAPEETGATDQTAEEGQPLTEGEPAEAGEALETPVAADRPEEGEQAAEGETPSEPDEASPEPEEPAEPVYDVSPWKVLFYPNSEKPGIVEIILRDGAK